jgi:hypothetical protein
MFPNKFSRWRNVEILSFIREHDVDILVYKIEQFANISFDFDVENKIFADELKNFNILIFDPAFNKYNKYNKALDGTRYNNLGGGSYLLTKRSSFNLTQYDAVYHVFLNVYESFNKTYKFPPARQFIHLYPGGGLINSGDVSRINPDVNLVTTHPLVTEWVRESSCLEALMGPFMEKDQVILKNKKKERLGVVFASLGHGYAKGDQYFVKLVEKYKKFFPRDKIDFYSIGNCQQSKDIFHSTPMDYISLSEFYREYCDIYLNLETGRDLNGWPLGIEAAIEGSLIFTSDTRDSSALYGVPSNSFFISNSLEAHLHKIKEIYENRELINVYGENTRDYLSTIITYENQQEVIFNFIKKNI